MGYIGIIYKYTSPSNKVYVGQTARPTVRMIEHKCHSKKGKTAFHKAILKYGIENFKYEVINKITCNTKEELSTQLGKLEQDAIKKYNCMVPNGYNLSEGGPGPLGHKVSEEARRRLSETHRGILHSEESKRKIALANTGHVMSKETKEKIAKSKSIPIVQLTLEGEFIREFPSAKVAADILGVVRSNITACCRNKPKVLSVGGYKWKYKKDYECYI